MESYLGVRQPSDKWRGTESPEADKTHLAQSKTIFEMIDIESVSISTLSLPARLCPLS